MMDFLSKEFIAMIFVLLAWAIKELVSYWRKKKSKETKEAIAHATIMNEIKDVKKEQTEQRQLTKHGLRFSTMIGTEMIKQGTNGNFERDFRKFQDDTRDELMD